MPQRGRVLEHRLGHGHHHAARCDTLPGAVLCMGVKRHTEQVHPCICCHRLWHPASCCSNS